MTPLMPSVIFHHKTVAQYLLENGAGQGMKIVVVGRFGACS